MKSKKLIGVIAVLAVISLVFAGAAAAASETTSNTAILGQKYSDGLILGGGAFDSVAAKEAVAADEVAAKKAGAVVGLGEAAAMTEAASETSSNTAILGQKYSDEMRLGSLAAGDVAVREAAAGAKAEVDGARARTANSAILVTTKAAASETAVPVAKADEVAVRGMGYLSTAAGAIHDVFNTTEKANTSSSTVKTMKDSRSSGMSSFHSQVTSDTANVANFMKNDSFSTDVAGLTSTSNMTQAKRPIILVGLNSFGSNVNFAGLNNTFNLNDYYSFANLNRFRTNALGLDKVADLSRFGTNTNFAALNSAFNHLNLYNLAALNTNLITTPVFLIDLNSYMKNLNTVSTNAGSTLRADLSRLTDDVNTTANVNTTSNLNSDTTNLNKTTVSSASAYMIDSKIPGFEFGNMPADGAFYKSELEYLIS